MPRPKSRAPHRTDPPAVVDRAIASFKSAIGRRDRRGQRAAAAMSWEAALAAADVVVAQMGRPSRLDARHVHAHALMQLEDIVGMERRVLLMGFVFAQSVVNGGFFRREDYPPRSVLVMLEEVRTFIGRVERALAEYERRRLMTRPRGGHARVRRVEISLPRWTTKADVSSLSSWAEDAYQAKALAESDGEPADAWSRSAFKRAERALAQLDDVELHDRDRARAGERATKIYDQVRFRESSKRTRTDVSPVWSPQRELTSTGPRRSR